MQIANPELVAIINCKNYFRPQWVNPFSAGIFFTILTARPIVLPRAMYLPLLNENMTMHVILAYSNTISIRTHERLCRA